MKSWNGRSETLNLDRDLITTPEDVAAQRRLRRPRPVSFDGYLRFLSNFPSSISEELRRKRGPRGDVPFQLLP